MNRALALLTVAGVALALPAAANAQGPHTVQVSASVPQIFSSTMEAGLDFGEVTASDALSILPLTVPAGGLSRGEIRIVHNTTFAVGFSVQQALTNGTDEITLDYRCAFTATSGGTSGLQGTDNTTTCASLTARTAAIGDTYIMVGGVGTVPANASAGTYEGELVFTLTPDA